MTALPSRVRSAVSGQPSRTGRFADGSEYSTWGGGPRTLLFIPGGPGSPVATGMLLRTQQRLLAPLVAAGFTVWMVTRRRNLEDGHSVADMADDYAQVIADELGGKVDVVLGESYGGMIAQYLAAFHSDRFEHVVVLAAACEVHEVDVDLRYGRALSEGDTTAAAMAMAEYVLPGDRAVRVRRLVAWLATRRPSRPSYPRHDAIVEAEAEVAFDSRAVLPRIRVPVLLLCGDRDRFFPKEVVEETARLIPDCTLVWYPGRGHLRACTSRRVAHDVLAFASNHGRDQPDPPRSGV